MGIHDKSVKVYFTSERNSYGAYNNIWLDGEVYEKSVEINQLAVVGLTPYNYTYLGDAYNQCVQESFEDQWKPFMSSNIDFRKCQANCSDATFLSDIIPICDLDDNYAQKISCAKKAIYETLEIFKGMIGHTRSCNILEYRVKKLREVKKFSGFRKLQISYGFLSPEMTMNFKEHLVFDMIGVIGSVGGTLGLYIGFSFSGVASYILGKIQRKIDQHF